MCKNRIISTIEDDLLKAVTPIVHNRSDIQKMKHRLLDDIIEFYGDKWWRLSEHTRSTIDFHAFLAAETGYSYPRPSTCRKNYGTSERTVQLRMKELVDAGLVVKLYRRSQTNNGLGNQVYFFVNHPRFHELCEILKMEPPVKIADCETDCETDCEAENAETPTAPTDSEPISSPNYVLPAINLKDLRERSKKRLGHEYVHKKVPKEFVLKVKPFFDDCFYIEEFWKAIELATHDHHKKGYQFDYTDTVNKAFDLTIRRIKNLKQEPVRNPIGYFTNTFNNLYKPRRCKETFIECLNEDASPSNNLATPSRYKTAFLEYLDGGFV